MLPPPGSKEYEETIAFMRADLESDMGYSKIEMAARNLFKEQGRDFDKEFEEFKQQQSKGE